MNNYTFIKYLISFVLLITFNQGFGLEVSDGNSKSNIDYITFNKEMLTNVGGSLIDVSATCENNGSITATASGGSGVPELYVFTLTNGPTSNGQSYPTVDHYDSSTFTFNDLYPGTYEVTIEDANDSNNPSYIQSITVDDNTENLDFSFTSQLPDCPAASGWLRKFSN